MNYLEAEDDGHGPVPMEVGAMKGKKLWQRKVLQKFGKARQKQRGPARTTSAAKGKEKGKESGKKGNGKGQRKDEKPAPNSSFQGYCRSCGKVEAQGE